MKSRPIAPIHNVIFKEILDIYAKHAKDLPAIEVLAIMSNLLGKLIALQDQTLYTPEQVMRIVAKNIETGNAEALADLLGRPGGHA